MEGTSERINYDNATRSREQDAEAGAARKEERKKKEDGYRGGQDGQSALGGNQ